MWNSKIHRGGSIGLETDGIWKMEEIYQQLFKKIKKIILVTASVGKDYILIQEKLTDNEYGLDVINDLEGNFVAVFVKQKMAMRIGETDKVIAVD